MTEVGQVLHRRRQELGLSLDDIQSKTKIRKRYIQAIEEGDWSALPGDVYARGFIRSYADALELDGFELLKQLDAEQQPAPPSSQAQEESPVKEPQAPVTRKPERTQSNQQQQESSPRSVQSSRTHGKSQNKTSSGGMQMGRSRRPRTYGGHVGQAVTVIVILGALGGGWWWLRTHTNSTTPTAVGQNIPSGSTNTSGNQNNTAGSTANTVNATPTPPKPKTQVTTKPFNGSTQTYQVKTSDTLQVQIQVSRPCWIEVVKQDSKSGSTAGITLQANQKKSWSANQQLIIRIGHYPGVTFTVNGQTVQLPKVNHPYDVTFIKS